MRPRSIHVPARTVNGPAPSLPPDSGLPGLTLGPMCCIRLVWPVEPEDVRLARLLVDRYPELGARDLLHLSCCKRRGIDEVKTFDRALSAAFERQ